MASHPPFGIALRTWLVVACCVAAPAARADDDGLDLLVGRWEARVETLLPQPAELTYTETYRWVLDGKFLEGRTTGRTDGFEDIIYGTYDPQTDGYPFWFFSSSGTYLYLAPGTWDARTRTFEWKNPANSDVSYLTRVVFPDARTRHWTIVIKDWKGKVLVQQEGHAVRRDD
jgi:Protein of unknown function (DUF1579)